MKYRKVFVYLVAFVLLFGLWYTAIDTNSDYWSYVNKNLQEVNLDTVRRLWTFSTALFGVFVSFASAIVVIGMTFVGLNDIRKEYKKCK